MDNAIQNKKTTLITSATGRKHYFGEMFAADIIFPLTEMEFEKHMFYAPRKWKEYLEGIYGNDYMTPPPDNERESHFITEISL